MNTRPSIRQTLKTATVTLLAVMTIVACTSVQPPTTDMAVAEAAVQRANARSAFEREEYVLASQLAAANARLAELEAQLQALNARPTPRGMVVTLGDVLFSTGQSELLAGASANMQRLAEFLRANTEQNAAIEGYTDSVGAATCNYALSQRRADAVRAELINLGVQPDRLSTRAFGEDNPVATNDTETGRQMNRRMEIVFTD